jgi:hypothetical protein
MEQQVKPGPAPQSPETSVIVSHQQQDQCVDLFNPTILKNALAFATELAASSMIPEHYQRRTQNVLVALMRARRFGMDPLAYMDTTYPVNGKIGHEAIFVRAILNNSGKLKGPIRFRFSGTIKRDLKNLVNADSDRACTAYAVLAADSSEVSQTVDVQMAFREGWFKNSKWHNITDEMLQNRSSSFLGKMYFPEIIMGLDTRDELEDAPDAETIDVTETGKDIFEKGKLVETAADPVLDPAKEVKQAAAEPVGAEPSSAPAQAAAAPAPAAAPETKPEQPAQTEVPTTPNPAPDKQADEPPKEISKFLEWLMMKFKDEASTVDAFLVYKKWLKPGDTLAGMSASMLGKLQEKYAKFNLAYAEYKAMRKSA